MAASLERLDAYISADDDFLRRSRYGLIKDPKERVSRRGVPDHRARFRETKTGVQNWEFLKERIIQLGRVRSKVGKFDYKRLPLSRNVAQIRLLHILPNKDYKAPVVCDLVVMDLSMVVNKYEALSYCWGTEEPDQAISIRCLIWDDGVKDYRRTEAEDFPVRSNLLRALSHLRRKDEAIFLWVDAICINQRPTPEATAEKNNQLSMMSRIYNSAKNVCVWLGDSDACSREAFLLLNSVTNFNIFHERLHDKNADIAKESWCSLVETLKTTRWFSRRWIIQEIASARSASVHCGDDIVHWDDLAAAISLLDENCAFMHRHFGHILFSEIPTLSATQLVKALTNVCRKTPTGEISERLLDFETLVCTFQQYQASFPQDVIHSVRALANDAPAEDDLELENGNGYGLGVDTKTSTRDLFIAFVRRCIRISGSLDIICRHWAPAVTDTAGKRITLPSWISELSNAPFGPPGESHERQNGENFVAISPSYKWKRYNASDNWMAASSRTQKPHAMPHMPQMNGLDKQARWSYPLPNFSPQDVVESPSGEKDGFFSAAETANSNSVQTPSPATQAVLQTELCEQPRLPSSRSAEMRGDPPGVTHAAQLAENIFERTAHLEKVPVRTKTNLDTPTQRKRSNTMPSSQRPFLQRSPSPLSSVPEHESNRDFWKEIANVAMFPNKVKVLMEDQEEPAQSDSFGRQDSKTKQESYVQDDKEHNTKFNGQLGVEGFVLGTIQECSDMMRDGIVTGSWLEKLGWQDGPHNFVPDQLWRLLVADRTANGGDPPEWYSRACLHCLKDSRLVNSRGDFNSHKELPPDSALDPMTSMYRKRVESVIWRRRIISLEADTTFGNDLFFALAPEKTREGDLVCILAGCSVPVVLKKCKAPDSTAPEGSVGVFELVGEAYVHKMMNGEAVRALKRHGQFETKKKHFMLQ